MDKFEKIFNSLLGEFKQFFSLVRDVWDNGIMGVSVGEMLVALGVFLLFLMFRKILARFFLGRIMSLAARTKTTVDDRMVEALRKPVAFIPVVMGLFFSLGVVSASSELEEFSSKVVRSFIVFNIFWIIYCLLAPMARLMENVRRVFSRTMVEWFVKAAKFGVAFLGAATILELWGIEVGPLLAGLGLFGVAVALGAQDLFKNLISGMLIIAEKRFNLGDWIKVDGVVEGTVEAIGFRSTMIRRFDKAPVYVPNTKLSDSAVTNFSSMTHRRIYWMIGLEYRSTIEQLRRIRDEIEDYVLGSEDFAKPPEVSTFVRIDKFADSSIDVMLYCFTKTTNWGEWLEIKEELAYRIKDIVESAGSGFAFPSQSVYVESVPGERPEVFVPPRDQG